MVLWPCLVTQLCPTLWDPMDYSPPGSSVHGIFQARYWSGLPFPSWSIFPTQGLNLCLLHCRQIVYHLSHQGSRIAGFRVQSTNHYTTGPKNWWFTVHLTFYKPGRSLVICFWLHTHTNLTIHYLGQTDFKYGDTNRLKLKGWRKIYHHNTNQRKLK